MKKLFLLSLTSAAILLANPYASNQETINAAVETGKKASVQLIKTLGGNLKKHMQAEGPAGAATFCHVNAFPLTDQVSHDMGKDVEVKRISLRYRNPANQPADESEAKVLESLQTLNDNGVMMPEYLLEQDDETFKFYKPLVINKGVCLKCHGDLSGNPELASFMKKNYPEDKATGHKMGDLRGAIVVTIKK